MRCALAGAFAPLGAQTAAKRPMDIEDVIAYRGMGAAQLSNDGQWMAYRMSPTQGDSEVIVRATTGFSLNAVQLYNNDRFYIEWITTGLKSFNGLDCFFIHHLHTRRYDPMSNH